MRRVWRTASVRGSGTVDGSCAMSPQSTPLGPTICARYRLIAEMRWRTRHGDSRTCQVPDNAIDSIELRLGRRSINWGMGAQASIVAAVVDWLLERMATDAKVELAHPSRVPT
jgi:hypothetical protein